MKKAVIYARYSSDKQTENSISAQLSICYKYAENNDIQIVGEYIDRALSASKNVEKRTEFQRMILNSKGADWKYVLVTKTDRFARNEYDSIVYEHALEKNGVKILSATQPISDTPEGIFVKAIFRANDAYYSKELGEKTKNGLRENFKKGLVISGSCPLGYDIVDKRLVINEFEADQVRKIFALAIDGNSFGAITKLMRDEGLVNKQTGMPYDQSSIGKILKNIKYTGRHLFEGVVYENKTPRILDDETFDFAQKRIMKNRHSSKERTKYKYLLSGMIFDAETETSYYGYSTTNSYGKEFSYYVPKNRQNKWIKRKEFEDMVFEKILKIIYSNFLDDILDGITEELNIQNKANLKPFKLELRETEKQIANMLKAIKMGIVTSSTKTELEILENKKNSIERRISELGTKHLTALSRAEVKKRFKPLKTKDLTEAEKEMLMMDIIDKVVIYGEYAIITFKVEGEDFSVAEIVEKVSAVLAGSPTK